MMEYARDENLPLAIEPLHPAYAADRACVNTTKHALDICDALDPKRTGALGVALDQVSIKAKTAEKMGPVGHGEAMEARAVCLIWRP